MIELEPLTPLVLASLAGLVLGLILGAVVTSWRSRRREQRLELELAVLEERLKTDAALEQERAAALEHATDKLQVSFDQIAGASLRTNIDIFLRLAREHLGQHQQAASSALSEREKAIESMLAPIREALTRTEAQIGRIEKERAESFGSLRQALEAVTLGQQTLERETRLLVNALRRPEVRGQWGELTLRRLTELAGMVEHCDFSEQVHVRSNERSARPDLIVHMPDGRDLVVDVKTPLDAYLEAIDATTEEVRAAALRRHALALKERIRELGAKSYWAQFERSPDFVVLFIPGDQFLSAALAEAPGLLEEGIRHNVILATPSSFLALLKAVAYGWRQTALARNAQIIRQLGEELYRRLGSFGGHLSRLGRSLNQSIDAYNSAVGSLERQVLPGARRFTELGLSAEREIDTLEPLDRLARTPQGSAAETAEDTEPTTEAKDATRADG